LSSSPSIDLTGYRHTVETEIEDKFDMLACSLLWFLSRITLFIGANILFWTDK